MISTTLFYNSIGNRQAPADRVLSIRFIGNQKEIIDSYDFQSKRQIGEIVYDMIREIFTNIIRSKRRKIRIISPMYTKKFSILFPIIQNG